MDWLLEISENGKDWMIIAREKTEKDANESADQFTADNPTWQYRVRMDK